MTTYKEKYSKKTVGFIVKKSRVAYGEINICSWAKLALFHASKF